MPVGLQDLLIHKESNILFDIVDLFIYFFILALKDDFESMGILYVNLRNVGLACHRLFFCFLVMVFRLVNSILEKRLPISISRIFLIDEILNIFHKKTVWCLAHEVQEVPFYFILLVHVLVKYHLDAYVLV